MCNNKCSYNWNIFTHIVKRSKMKNVTKLKKEVLRYLKNAELHKSENGTFTVMSYNSQTECTHIYGCGKTEEEAWKETLEIIT